MDVGDGGKGGDGTADMYELRKERKQLFCGQRSTERSKELESALYEVSDSVRESNGVPIGET